MNDMKILGRMVRDSESARYDRMVLDSMTMKDFHIGVLKGVSVLRLVEALDAENIDGAIVEFEAMDVDLQDGLPFEVVEFLRVQMNNQKMAEDLRAAAVNYLSVHGQMGDDVSCFVEIINALDDGDYETALVELKNLDTFPRGYVPKSVYKFLSERQWESGHNKIESNDDYLGDGVYASFDGFGVKLDFRAQDSTTVIFLEREVFDALVKYGNEKFGSDKR